MFYFEPVTFFMHFFLFFSGGCCLFFLVLRGQLLADGVDRFDQTENHVFRLEKSVPPKIPTAISMTFPRMINFLNSLMNPFSFIFFYSSSFVFSPANHAFSIISSSRISIQLGMLPSLTAFWHSLRSIQRTASTSDSCRCSFSASTGFV